MKRTKFTKLFPEAKNITLGSNGKTWGVWFKINGKKQFYSIEALENTDIEFEIEIHHHKRIISDNPNQIQKICLN